MKKIKIFGIVCLVCLICSMVYSENAQDMMGQYKDMGEGTSKNFPKELEVMMPKGFSIKSKGFIFKETANMFLVLSLTGEKKNDVYKSSSLNSEIEIGIMAYSPSASYMSAQMPIILEESKKGYSKQVANESGNWDLGPVAASKINGADVYIQKGTRKHVEVDHKKFEDQIYFFCNAVMVHKNLLVNIKIIYFPGKSDGLTQALQSITQFITSANFDKYMK